MECLNRVQQQVMGADWNQNMHLVSASKLNKTHPSFSATGLVCTSQLLTLLWDRVHKHSLMFTHTINTLVVLIASLRSNKITQNSEIHIHLWDNPPSTTFNFCISDDYIQAVCPNLGGRKGLQYAPVSRENNTAIIH